MPETGYSSMALSTVQKKLIDLNNGLSKNNKIKYVHRIDNVLFSHGGVSDFFVRKHVPASKYNDIDGVIEAINCLGIDDMWNDDSPIWLRPQYSNTKMYKPRKVLQIVGHTPVEKITRDKNIISCDVFSTYSDGRPIGTKEFLVLDTVTWEYTKIKI